MRTLVALGCVLGACAVGWAAFYGVARLLWWAGGELIGALA